VTGASSGACCHGVRERDFRVFALKPSESGFLAQLLLVPDGIFRKGHDHLNCPQDVSQGRDVVL
jgi:hypothetical protein